MIRSENKPEQRPTYLVVGEGGSGLSSEPDRQYGRRIERDGSWTVYDVFSGVPAQSDGHRLVSLSLSDATDSMLTLNRRNAQRRKDGSCIALLPQAELFPTEGR